MNFTKKILIGGALTTVVVCVTVVPMAILSVSSPKSVSTFDIGISQKTEEYYGEKIIEQSYTNPTKIERKAMLITAGGAVNDKSFNESAWGALQLFKKQANIACDEITYRETFDDANLHTYYNEAINNGYKTLVLTGFQQAGTFKAWLDISNNHSKFVESKAVVIGVDWNGSDIIPEGQFFGLGFKTEEASWVVGQAAANYLTTIDKTPHISSFGGGIFDGVTDFNNGFLQGILDWNIINPGKKIKFYSGNNQASTINLSTGFAPTADVIDVINNIVGTTSNSPQIILPVAGSLTTTTLDNIKNKNSSQLVIGVDSNQALAFPNEKAKFFSSIEKKVAVAVYKAVILLAGIPLDFDEEGEGDNGFQGNFVEIGATTPKNAFVKYGFDKGLVNYSASTIEGAGIVVANKALRTAYNLFIDSKPKFESMTDASKNQEILDGLIKKINA